MDISRLCMGCMKELDDNEDCCPNCGYKKGTHNSSRGLQPQTILNGKYLIGKIIGEGGFGITYIAYDLVLNNRVAIKEFYPNEMVTRDTSTGVKTSLTVLTGKNEELYKKGLDRFVKEAANLAKFNNIPGIVSVKEFFYENNTAYMVMEYIEGVTLSKYLDDNEGKLPYTRVLELIMPVINALEKVHEAGIVHRDISPDNIMISSNGTMKLIDFGTARIVENDNVKSLTVILKHGYAPIEQYQPDGKQGPWTDIYALSATMYRMITGVVPQESTDRILSGDKVIPVNKIDKGISKNISKAIMHGLEINAAKRPQKLLSFKSELMNGRKNRLGIYLGISAVLLIMITIGILVNRRNGDNTAVEKEDINQIADEKNTFDLSVKEDSNHKTKEELMAMVEESSGQEIVLSAYEDFNGDGYKELYALTLHNDEKGRTGNSGQIWYAGTKETTQVMDTNLSSEYIYSSGSEYGLLHFGEITHFYIECQSDEDIPETLSFGVIENKPQLIFQGNAKFINSENGVILENQKAQMKYEYEVQPGICKVMYIHNQYCGCGLSPVSIPQFYSISGIETEFEKAINQLNKLNISYPHKVIESIYYSADDCIYLNMVCFASEEGYEELNKSADYENPKSKLDWLGIDYSEYTLVFSRKSGQFYFSEIEEKMPSESSILPMFYKSADFWYENNIDTGNMSDEEIKEAYINQLYEHFLLQDTELQDTELDDELLRCSVFEDFDNDGSKELIVGINSVSVNYGSDVNGIYHIDDDGITTMYQGISGTGEYISEIDELRFGKKQMYSFLVEGQLDSNSYLFEIYGDGVIEYDQLWSMDDYHGLVNVWNEGDKIVLYPVMDIVCNLKTGEIMCGSINQGVDYYIDSAQIWYIDGRFVECASVEIDKTSFMKLKGAEDIVNNIEKYALDVLKSTLHWALDFSDVQDLNDFDIESILYCGDGYIYINYLPVNPLQYGDMDEEDMVSGLPSVVLKIEAKEDELQLIDVYSGYKVKRLTDLKPYYPQMIELAEEKNEKKLQESFNKDNDVSQSQGDVYGTYVGTLRKKEGYSMGGYSYTVDFLDFGEKKEVTTLGFDEDFNDAVYTVWVDGLAVHVDAGVDLDSYMDKKIEVYGRIIEAVTGGTIIQAERINIVN